MKFHLGVIPEEADFDPASNPWSPIREPHPWVLMAVATPIGLLSGFLVASLWKVTTPLGTVSFGWSPFEFLAYLAGLILVHECLHVLTHPGWGLSDKSLIGIWPSHLTFYAAYLGELSRERFIAVFLMPLLLITLLPLLVGMVTQLVTRDMVSLSVANAFLSCGDLVGAYLVVSQVPRGAITRNQGWKTYWRRRDP